MLKEEKKILLVAWMSKEHVILLPLLVFNVNVIIIIIVCHTLSLYTLLSFQLVHNKISLKMSAHQRSRNRVYNEVDTDTGY